MVELIFIVDGMHDEKTLNCCNFLNIDPYDLIFLKWEPIEFKQCDFVFVHD